VIVPVDAPRVAAEKPVPAAAEPSIAVIASTTAHVAKPADPAIEKPQAKPAIQAPVIDQTLPEKPQVAVLVPAEVVAPEPAPKVIVKPKALAEKHVAQTHRSAAAVKKPVTQPKPAEKKPGFVAKVVTATKSLINRAVSWLGTRYVWGGTSKKGIDCSGLTSNLYSKEGVKLPHSAKMQASLGEQVSGDKLLPGDLVFFNTKRGPFTHVGVYIGNGQFLHASNPKRGVRVDKLSSPYYSKRLAGARRYKEAVSS